MHLTEIAQAGRTQRRVQSHDEAAMGSAMVGRQHWDLARALDETQPHARRASVVLRHMEGCGAEEACELLKITAENQRVPLHRALSGVRAAVDAAADEAPPTAAAKPSRPPRAASRRGLVDRNTGLGRWAGWLRSAEGSEVHPGSVATIR
jgi:hypothetical protein